MKDDSIEIPIENKNKIVDESTAEKERQQKTQKDDESAYIEMLQRLQAEFDNYRKRVKKESTELSDRVKSQLIYKLLPVLDDFERMIDLNKPGESDGAFLIYQKLIDILSVEGLEAVPAVGERFNPECHEAVIIVQVEDEADDDIVTEELQKGYYFKKKLLRPAKVKVSKHTTGI